MKCFATLAADCFTSLCVLQEVLPYVQQLYVVFAYAIQTPTLHTFYAMTILRAI